MLRIIAFFGGLAWAGLSAWLMLLQLLAPSHTDAIGFLMYTYHDVNIQWHRFGAMDIFQASTDRHFVQRLTLNPQVEAALAWSPDGTWFVYSRYISTPTHSGVYLFRQRVGSRHEELLTACGTNNHPKISPTGEWIVFQSNCEGGLGVYVIRSNGTDYRRVTPKGLNVVGFQQWSSDGQWIVFVAYGGNDQEIFRVRRDGADLQQLTQNTAHDTFPHWQGDWIAYLSGAAPENIAMLWNYSLSLAVWRMRSDGSEQLILTEAGARSCCVSPQVSPDGKWVLYVKANSYGSGGRGVHKVRMDGSEDFELVADGWLPKWSPDGKQIVYLAGRLTLHLMDSEGTFIRALSGNTGQDPIWIRVDKRERPFWAFSILGSIIAAGALKRRR